VALRREETVNVAVEAMALFKGTLRSAKEQQRYQKRISAPHSVAAIQPRETGVMQVLRI
jgi:hypothetical protein